jgi:hypothetical protein
MKTHPQDVSNNDGIAKGGGRLAYRSAGTSESDAVHIDAQACATKEVLAGKNIYG